MTLTILLIPVLAALTAAVVFQMTPGGHPGFLFGVPVAEGFRQSAPSQAILRRFTLGNWITALVAGWAGALGLQSGKAWLMVAPPLLQAVAGTLLFHWSKARVEPFAIEPRSSVRRAALRPEPVMAWWSWILVLLPLLILIGSAEYLAQHWDQIPARFPIHWGINGQPDRWGEKSFKGVYGVLIIGLSTLVLLYSILAMTVLGAPRRGPATTRFVRLTVNALAGSGLFVSLLMSYIALHPLTANPEKTLHPLWIVLAVMAASIALVRTLSRAAQDAEAEAGGAPEEGWLWSSFYYAPQDPAMMVQRRIGVGFTPNFAHPVVKWAFPLLLLQMFAVIFLVTH